MKRIFSVTLILVLVLTSALYLTACSKHGEKEPTSSNYIEGMLNDVSEMEYAELGKGKTKFKLEIVDTFGYKSNDIYFINTDKKYLSDALLEFELIKGEEGQNGLYVDTVVGVTLDNKKEFWAFYVNGEKAQTGVDKIEVKSTDTYAIKREKIK